MPLRFLSAALMVACLSCCLFISQLSNAQASAYANSIALNNQVKGVPLGLLADTQTTPHLIWVALKSGRLHVLQRTVDNQYIEVDNIPISIGKEGYGKQVEGDQKTPVGVYRITSFIEDKGLDDFYGLGAYPLNYPNHWDRLSGRTGYGIWLHGLPKGVESRPLNDSNGCVVIDNFRLDQYSQYIATGDTTVVLAETLEWVTSETSQEHSDVLDALKLWETQWESTEPNDYLSNYDEDFTDYKQNLDQWKEYKSRINRAKSYINVELTNLSVIAYPNEEDMVVSRFYQEYESSNYNWKGWKQLIWRRNEQGEWRIIFEGNG